MATKYVSARIMLNGMGGFLNPPGHPEHTSSVETDLRRRRGNRGMMSLSAAAACDYIDPAVRAEARRKLDEYASNPPAFDSEPVRTWVRQVLGYFRGCYRNPSAATAEQWHASQVVIDRERDPVANAADHAGVRFVRQWYPDFQPTTEDFASAKWGA